MPLRSTLADALSPNCRITASLGYGPNDPRVISWINAASGRLFAAGNWIGTTEKATIQVTSQLLTLPSEFATAEQIALNHHPLDLRNQWFEYSPDGWGVIDDPAPGMMRFSTSGALRRNSACTFLDIPRATPMKVNFRCDVLADVGVKVVLLGFDNATPPNWVRTETALGSGVWQDGEVVSLTQSPGTTSATTFSRLTGIQFPAGRSGQSWLSTSDGTLIGHYQHWETYPSYARYLLPFIPTPSAQVDILGKRNFRPVSKPTDWLPIPNLEALRLGCMAVKREEENDFKSAAVFMNGVRDLKTGHIIQDGALTILDKELQHFTGSGEIAAFRTFGAVGPAGEPIEALL